VIRLGPAGWTYPDYPGHVYPADAPKKFDVLAFLARYYDTIEINASFYAPQPPRNFTSWVKRVAHNEKFRFTAKLWQKFTHGVAKYGRHDELTYADAMKSRGMGEGGREPLWEAKDVREVQDGFGVLREANLLGAILAQFPWSFRPSAFNFHVLERLAEDFAGWPVVVELRHGAWAQHDHALMLKRLGLGFCNIDQPVIGESLEPTAGVTSDVGYVRLHGRRYDTWFEERASVSARYDYLYTAEELKPWAERINRIAAAEGVKDVYVVANNHFEGKGAANALMLSSMLSGSPVASPPVLYQTYAESLAPFATPMA
jgi:uncharacterized protein YecE (DUF72 family)